MRIYTGIFIIAFSVLAFEISLVRLLSVTSWYHLAFFAISSSMLGMTAGAVRVYLKPERFEGASLTDEIARTSIHLAICIPVTAAILCLLPFDLFGSAMGFISLLLATGVCALPFYFAGIVVTAVLTKVDRPISQLYSADLLGASLGCLGVLAALEHMDAPSVMILWGAACALGAFCFSGAESGSKRRRAVILCGALAVLGIASSATPRGIRPVIVKGKRVEPESTYEFVQWNSFSRIAVYPQQYEPPQYWAAGPTAPRNNLYQHWMNIDGEAGTVVRRFQSQEDIEHLRYDVTNIGYHLGRQGRACVIGVGGGRDIQSALLFGHEHVTGVELNPIFVDLLRGKFREFAGIGNRPEVTLVADEARGYLSRTPGKYAVIQMSLIDTWAATGAGAFSLSENALYTMEAWELLFSRLQPNGIFTVSRWHSPEEVGETGRLVSLAAAAVLRLGVAEPARHIALITAGRISTLLVSPQPFSPEDVDRLIAACKDLHFQPLLLPGMPPALNLFGDMLAAKNLDQLYAAASKAELNYDPPTDENPYFFHMLRFGSILSAFTLSGGVIRGNLTATLTLAGLLVALMLLAATTVFVPLLIRNRSNAAEPGGRPLWWGAVYFSLIGAGFMLTEIAMIQRLTVLLSHPIYALGILLFTLIASTGIGSLLSGRLPLDRAPWRLVYPAVTAAAILAERFLLSYILEHLLTAGVGVKIAASIAVIFPLGILLGFFFPTGMVLVKALRPQETPWYWALNGVFGVLCSALAVFISIYAGVSVNFYLAAACYLGVLLAQSRLSPVRTSAQTGLST